MGRRASVSAVALAVALVGSARASAAVTFPFDSVSSQSITTSDPTESPRLTQASPGSTCGTAKTFPGTFGSSYHYRAFTHTNRMNNSACVVLRLDPQTCTANPSSLQAVTYDTSFDPANIATNYLADIGVSPTGVQSYSFTVPAGHTFVDVVNVTGFNAGCASFAVTWSSDFPWAESSPAITGTPQVGHQLQASTGTWSVAQGFTFQWRRCAGSTCSDIAGATSATYTPTASDLGQRLLVRVSTTSPANAASSADSATTAAVTTVPVLSSASVSPAKTSATGRRARGRCVRQTRKNRSHKRCRRALRFKLSYTLDQAATIAVSVKSKKGRTVKSSTAAGTAGANTLTLAPMKLKRGSYTLTITPTANGLTGTPRTVPFKLV